MIFTRGSRSSNALTILSTGYATLQPNAGQTARHRGQEKAPNAPQHKVQTTATKGTPLAKTLVTYFSATGTTKDVATRLARVADGDLFAIVPANPYTSADLDWRDKRSRSTLEAANPSCRPVITSRVEHIEDYGTIFLGFPIWWYVAPAIVNTFLESYDLTGKTIVLFATSGGSGMGKTASILRASAPGAKIVDGGVLNNVSDTELEKLAARYL